MTPDILAAMGPLPFPCYSWPLPGEVFTDPPRSPSTLWNWARVTHSVSLKGEPCTEHRVHLAAEACRQVNRFNPDIRATIALNFSPYQHATYERTYTGWDWIQDILFYQARLRDIRQWAGDVAVSAVLLDHERWKVGDGSLTTGDVAWKVALDYKYNVFYWIAKHAFPDVSVYLYGRGESGQHLTGNELGDGTSTRLYRPDDLEKMLGHIRGHRNSTSRLEAYGPDIGWYLAGGWSRNRFIGDAKPEDRMLPIDYPVDNDRQIGAAIAENAPHEPVILYPSPFDPRLTDGWGHFAAFAEGAGS